MELTAEQAWKLHTDKDKEFNSSGLYTRMDADADIAKKKKFSLTYPEGSPNAGKSIPNTVHVTLPLGAIFLNKANNILAGANERVEVNGVGMSEKEKSKREHFFQDCLEIADDYLPKNYGKLFTITSGHATSRGRLARRVLVEIDDEGKLIVRITPWDTRYATYEFDSDGTVFAGYTTKRTKAMIESEYQKVISATTAKVTSIDTRNNQFVYLDGKHLTTIPHGFGYVPVAIAYATAGLPFFDEDMEKNLGESIFWLVRDMFPESNRIASVAMTLHMGSLFPPVQKPYEEVPNEQPESPYGGVMTTVPYRKDDGAYTAFPRADMYQATRFIWSVIDSVRQQGSFSTSMFGTLQFPLSSVALEGMREGQELVLIPPLDCIAQAERQTCDMIKKQFIALGKSVEIKGIGKRASYAPKDIEGEYNIFFRYFTGSRKYALAGISEGQAYKALGFSDEYIMRNAVGVEKPDEELAARAEEKIRRINPALEIYDNLKAMLDKPDDEIEWAKAWLLRKQLTDIVRQQFAMPEVEEPKQPMAGQSSIPLFSGSPSKTGGRQQSGITAEESRKSAAATEIESEEA